jgi:RND family efflux transporter MFP subunit
MQTAESQIEGARAAAESARSRVEGARASLTAAEAQLEGALAGIESAKAGAENARAGIQSAEAAVAAVEKDIERLRIHAPFAGLLETDTAELGALLQPGGNCATVIQLDPIRIVGFVPETDIARIQLGAPAIARLVDDRRVSGTVSFVSRSADPVTRTFRVELTVDNTDLSLRDGQTAEIAIEAEGAQAHLLPQSALTLDDDGRLGVRTVAADNTALFTPVTVLRDARDGVWLAGLPDRAEVIVVGQEYVIDGVPVAPSFEEVLQ